MISKSLLPNYLEEFFRNLKRPVDVDSLEQVFEYIEAQNYTLSEFIVLLTDTYVWQYPEDKHICYKDLCYKLAAEIDSSVVSLEYKPAYHSIGHFVDVCFSVTLLCTAVRNFDHEPEPILQLIKPKDYWLLLLCAIGHDYGHDGSFNSSPQQLEKKSVNLIKDFLNKQQLDFEVKLALINSIEVIILATDPKTYPALYDKFRNPVSHSLQSIDLLSILLVEADLLASILPKRGILLSERLSLEWLSHSPEASSAVVTKAGRLGFLNFVKFLSPYAKFLGIDKIQKLSIELSS